MSKEEKEAPTSAAKPTPNQNAALREHAAEYAARLLPWLVIIATAIAYQTQGIGFSILVLAACTMLLAVALLWGSLRSLLGETALPRQAAFAMGAPSTEEEQKRAVLRAIKDLEFERSVGKISEEDYQLYIGRYRLEAKRLLRIIDERQQPERERVMAMVDERLQAAGLSETDAPAPETAGAASSTASAPTPDETPARNDELDGDELDGDELDDDELDGDELDDDADANEHEAEENDGSDIVICPQCDTENDADARFCKQCATPLQDAASAEAEEEEEA